MKAIKHLYIYFQDGQRLALRFPQQFSIKNDLDPFNRDFYWWFKCTANRGTNVPQCTAVPFKCFDPLPKIVSNTFHRF